MTGIPSILLRIKKDKELEVRKLYSSGKAQEYLTQAYRQPPCKDFVATISKAGHLNLIAEFKKASPSKGKIRPYARPETIAKLYERCGASAISVLTDYIHFGGKVEHLKRVRNSVNLPLLRKDFIIDPTQIYESRVYGADAILLIAALLEPSQIEDYILLAHSLGMDCIVESHNEGELEKAIKGNARIFGINNRNLHKLSADNKTSVDRTTTLRLLKHIPEGYPIVTESGISTYKHVKELSHPRVNAMLVGEAIMSKELNPTSTDMENKIYELLGK